MFHSLEFHGNIVALRLGLSMVRNCTAFQMFERTHCGKYRHYLSITQQHLAAPSHYAGMIHGHSSASRGQRSFQRHDLHCSYCTFLVYVLGKVLYFILLPWFCLYHSVGFFRLCTYFNWFCQKSLLPAKVDWLAMNFNTYWQIITNVIVQPCSRWIYVHRLTSWFSSKFPSTNTSWSIWVTTSVSR